MNNDFVNEFVDRSIDSKALRAGVKGYSQYNGPDHLIIHWNSPLHVYFRFRMSFPIPFRNHLIFGAHTGNYCLPMVLHVSRFTLFVFPIHIFFNFHFMLFWLYFCIWLGGRHSCVPRWLRGVAGAQSAVGDSFRITVRVMSRSTKIDRCPKFVNEID